MDKTLTKTIGNLDDLIKLFGTYDENIAIIESELNVSITTIGSNLNIRGDEENVNMASDIIDTLFKTLNADEPLKKKQVMLAIELARTGNLEDISGLMSIVAITARGKRLNVRPRSGRNMSKQSKTIR